MTSARLSVEYFSPPETDIDKTFDQQPRIGYLPEIDGLRAWAVLLVVFCHARFGWLAGGYVGVDVFFVISGYVVCRAILADQAGPGFGLKHFYTRRLKRLAPSLYLVMAATLAFSLVYSFPENNLALIKNIGFVALFYSNIYLSKQTGYFDLQADKQPLLHTWSLSVEEQFYLIVPLMLILVRKLRGTSKLVLFTVLWALAFAYSWYSVTHAFNGAYFHLQARVFEFLCGMVLAFALDVFPVRTRRYVYDVPLVAGLALILACGLRYGASTAMPGLAALWPCLGAMLVIVGVQGARAGRHLLANRASVFTGRISYVLYLWHWPVIFAFTRVGLTSAAWMGAAIGLSFVLAVATHHLVENPSRRVSWPPKKTFIMLFALPVLVVAALLLGAKYTGNFIVFYPQTYQKDYRDAGITVFNDARAKTCWSKVAVAPEDRCTVGDAASPRKAVLLGDSHAYHLISFMDRLGKDNRLAIHDMTFTMCAPIENNPAHAGDPGFQGHAQECREHGRQVMAYLLSKPDIRVVFMSAVWDLYENTGSGDGVQPTGHGFMPGQINAELAATVAKLEAAGKRVVFLDEIPLLPPELDSCVSNRLYLPGREADACTYPKALAADRYRHIDAILSEMRARFPRTATIHTYDVACNEATCGAELNGTGLYGHNDRGHLGSGGSAIFYDAYLARHPGEARGILASSQPAP
jgi:peptidoglycan/LPS O-acetylase OafA/YrhL